MPFSAIFSATSASLRILAADKGRFYIAIVLCVLGGGIELVGVGSFYPFLALLTRPELIESNSVLRFFFQFGEFDSVERFLQYLGTLALFTFFFATAFLYLKSAYVIRFCVGQTTEISVRLLDSYLHRPLSFHAAHNSGSLSKDVITQSDQFTNGVLLSVMTLIADGAVLTALVALILSINFRIGLATIVVLGCVLGVTLSIVRGRMQELGKQNDEANGARFAFCVGALQSVKEIKTSGTESYFGDLFKRHASLFAHCYSNAQTTQLLPQSIMQFTAVGSVVGLALYFIATGKELHSIVPTLTLYAVAGYRLLPSLNRLSGAYTQIQQYGPAIANISKALNLQPARPEAPSRHRDTINAPVKLVEFCNVDFKYDDTQQNIFENLSANLASGRLHCLVGQSGSGKTTFADLMLGLSMPDRGTILVNGKSIDDIGKHAWRKLFAYVPQSVYILDGTIAENIAFGIHSNKIDSDRLWQAIKSCRLTDLISSLPEGVDSHVGERGSKLSGGQRQRLGIARAIYRDAPILIFDESTSSLDGISEKSIIDTLLSLRNQKMIVAIAHRSSIVRQCDHIILMDRGRILMDGTYQELLSFSPLFASLMAEPTR